MALLGLKILHEQRELLFCVEGLRDDFYEWVARLKSLESQVAAHSAELVSVHRDNTRLEESVEVAWRQLADA